MILESALLNVKAGREADFETAIRAARPLIAASPGFQGLEVRRCLETPNRYILLVWWARLEDHTEGFRGSERYRDWRARLHDFYDPLPTVEHFSAPIHDEVPSAP